MRRELFFGILLLIFLSSAMTVSAAEHHLMHKIMEHHCYCVAAFDGDKIFIRSENIISTQHGLQLDLDGFELCQLPLLGYSKQGHFIQQGQEREIELITKKQETKGPCPECGVNTNKYGICKNSQCFFYGLKVL